MPGRYAWSDLSDEDFGNWRPSRDDERYAGLFTNDEYANHPNPRYEIRRPKWAPDSDSEDEVAEYRGTSAGREAQQSYYHGTSAGREPQQSYYRGSSAGQEQQAPNYQGSSSDEDEPPPPSYSQLYGSHEEQPRGRSQSQHSQSARAPPRAPSPPPGNQSSRRSQSQRSAGFSFGYTDRSEPMRYDESTVRRQARGLVQVRSRSRSGSQSASSRKGRRQGW